MSPPDIRRLTCHCGARELRVVLAEPSAAARRCDSSFCRRRGVMNVTVNDDNLRVVTGDTLSLYQSGTYRAEHFFCKICGCYTHHRRCSNGLEFGANVGGLGGVNPRDFDPVPWHDGVNYNPQQQGNV